LEIPYYEPLYLSDLDALRSEIQRLGLTIPTSEDTAILSTPIGDGTLRSPNRFCAQPITGCDGTFDGTPTERTIRRYVRVAAGGYGLIWLESTLAGGQSQAAALRLDQNTEPAFRELVRRVQESAPTPPLLILQLRSSFKGSADHCDDRELGRLRDELVSSALRAADTGFAGIDLQACHRTLAGALLRGCARGTYGGSLENRARFLRETIAAIRARNPGLLIASRLCVYDAIRGGFGVAENDFRQMDLHEPLTVIGWLREAGADLFNITIASPVLARQLAAAKAMGTAAAGAWIVGSGFSWLRQLIPAVGAAAIHEGAVDFVGLGRAALAYPQGPGEWMETRQWDAGRTCMVCFACGVLRDNGQPVGCVIRNAQEYGAIYQHVRRTDEDQLLAGARRCHLCEAAPCVRASATGTDIPGFIAAYRAGSEAEAYERMRATNPLPEQTALLSPRWLEAEGACIEVALTGSAVPISDLQYSIAWRARQNGLTGVRLPAFESQRTIAIVGGGPAGVASAIHLLELGHRVEIIEATAALGGMPVQTIPGARTTGALAEISVALAPAFDAGRLTVRYNTTLGANCSLGELGNSHDAVILTTGVWEESSLGSHPNVQGALDFLRLARRGAIPSVPPRVAVLAGGDTAMDAARTAQTLGAREVFVIFGGPRSELHWHMTESWFASPGVHAMMEWAPLGYTTVGERTAVCLRHASLNVETTLPVDVVLEAMGLQVAAAVRSALQDLAFTERGLVAVDPHHRTNLPRVYAAGGLVNGGASVGRCVAEGLAAAATAHGDFNASAHP
jgi:NADPH-dependent glutamate synthase beta subunit-like oxidoreductase/2,4-dienoyl-CoA reductase-like NADH-dependent reductase (Old Yellow Enzyme family)